MVLDLTLDPMNANRGTERGRALLERSLADLGAGRSIVVDRNGIVIAGNKTAEAALEAGFGLREVETDGTELVVVRRTDLDLSGPSRDRAVSLALADNRVAEVSLEWDADVLEALREERISGLETFWHEGELEALMPDPEPPEPDPLDDEAVITIRCTRDTAVEWAETLREMPGATEEARVLSLLAYARAGKGAS